MRVLVADDCVDTTATLAALLKLWGHDVRVAHNGPAALEQAESFRPDAVLLDLALNGKMDGFEVARRLRLHPDTSKALLICISGYGRDTDRQHSLVAGFDYHLIKPADPNELERLLAARQPFLLDRNPSVARDKAAVLVRSAGIEELAERCLRSHSDLAGTALRCAYEDGVLSLRGRLPTYHLRQLAESVVARLQGVTRVDNQIEVVACPVPLLGPQALKRLTMEGQPPGLRFVNPLHFPECSKSLTGPHFWEERFVAHPQRSCITACVQCARECEHCAKACLNETEAALEDCAGLVRDCAQFCWTVAVYVSRGSHFIGDLCRVCAELCAACAESCANYEQDYCQRCAEACNRCAEECRLACTIPA